MRINISVISLFLCAVQAAPSLNPRQEEGEGECKAAPLNRATWDDLGIEKVLTDKVSGASGSGIQSLAASMGAPNFFCGLDRYCNAGQPCTPVKLPEWYGLVAIQNWNSYMNSLARGISFATSTISLRLPKIVEDFKPEDKNTDINEFLGLFTGVMAIVPFTGPVVGSGIATIRFINNYIATPSPVDTPFKWESFSSSMADVVESWQAALAKTVRETVQAAPDSEKGIIEQVTNGDFLGVPHNVTEEDVSNTMSRSIELYSLGLALRSRKFTVKVSQPRDNTCADTDFGEEWGCIDEEGGKHRMVNMFKSKGKYLTDTVRIKSEIKKLKETYGMTTEQILTDQFQCWKDSGRIKDVTYDFEFVPADPSHKCIFRTNVCEESNPCPIPGCNDVMDCRSNQGYDV